MKTSQTRLNDSLQMLVFCYLGMLLPQPVFADNSCTLSMPSNFSTTYNLPSNVAIGGSSLIGTTSGNIGIGTSPNQRVRLDIASKSPSSSPLLITDQTNSLFKLDNSGNINVGKPSQTQPIQINSQSIVANGNVSVANGATFNGLLKFNPTSSVVAVGGNLSLKTGSTDSTTSLVVRGPDALSSSPALQISDSSGSNLMTVMDDGRVGIGPIPAGSRKISATSAPDPWPAQALEVAGSIRVSSGFVTLKQQPVGSATSTPPASLTACSPTLDGAVVLTANHGLCVCVGAGGIWYSTQGGSFACKWN